MQNIPVQWPPGFRSHLDQSPQHLRNRNSHLSLAADSCNHSFLVLLHHHLYLVVDLKDTVADNFGCTFAAVVDAVHPSCCHCHLGYDTLVDSSVVDSSVVDSFVADCPGNFLLTDTVDTHSPGAAVRHP